jgi:hypothetical protein
MKPRKLVSYDLSCLTDENITDNLPNYVAYINIILW